MKFTSQFALAIVLLGPASCQGDDISRYLKRRAPPLNLSAFTVALWGDSPYAGQTVAVFNQTTGTNYSANSDDNPGIQYVQMRDCINGAAGNICNTTAPPSFVWFAGDMNSGSTPCTQKYYDRFEELANSFLTPSLLVLGDNEWVDCHKSKIAFNDVHDPLVQLKYVKTRFFDPSGLSLYGLGQIQTLNGGHEYPELQMWTQNGIMFIGVHVPGSNNGFYDNVKTSGLSCASSLQLFDPNCTRSNSEFYQRDRANIAWLKKGFGFATALGLKGIMIVQQADMFKTLTCSQTIPYIPTGYINYYNALMNLTINFPGQVAVVHGDSHVFKFCNNNDTAMNLPTYGYVKNFVDLQVPGSINVGYVQATIDPNSPNVFSFQHFNFTPGPWIDA